MKDDRQCTVCKHPNRRLIDDLLKQHEANPKAITLTEIIYRAGEPRLTKASLSRYKNRPADEVIEGETESGEKVTFKRKGTLSLEDALGNETPRSAMQLILDYGAAAIREGIVVPGPRDMADAAKVLAKLPPDDDEAKQKAVWGELVKKKESERKKRTRTREVTVKETFTEEEHLDETERDEDEDVHEAQYTVEENTDGEEGEGTTYQPTERRGLPAPADDPEMAQLRVAVASRPGLEAFARRAEAHEQESRGAIRPGSAGEGVLD